jgi:hypothetical protein
LHASEVARTCGVTGIVVKRAGALGYLAREELGKIGWMDAALSNMRLYLMHFAEVAFVRWPYALSPWGVYLLTA